MPARVETVVLFLPDVWSCSPTRLEWQATVSRIQSELERKLSTLTADDDDAGHAELKALNALLLLLLLVSLLLLLLLLLYKVAVLLLLLFCPVDKLQSYTELTDALLWRQMCILLLLFKIG